MIVLVSIGCVLLIGYVVNSLLKPKIVPLRGSHIVITGGSMGIGKALALESARRGASITIMARNMDKLQETANEITNVLVSPTDQRVYCAVCDVTSDSESVKKTIDQAIKTIGPIDVLINCAGISIAKTFDDTSIEEFQRLMNVNYMGCVNLTKAVLGGMKARKRGRIVFVSSQAGQLGVFGYTAYSSTKYALRGLAESLQMEVKPYNIYVTVSFPPDTDTPGFREEMAGDKPEETKQISATSGFFKADVIARQMLDDTERGVHLSYNGLDGWMLATLTCGMTPTTSVFQVIQQVACLGIVRVISLCYLASFDRIISKCKKNRDTKAKSD